MKAPLLDRDLAGLAPRRGLVDIVVGAPVQVRVVDSILARKKRHMKSIWGARSVWAAGIAAVGAVIGYVGSRSLGYSDPAIFAGIGAFAGAIVGMLVERSRAYRA
jgi:urea transporter